MTKTHEVDEQEFKQVIRPAARTGDCTVCGEQVERFATMWVGQISGEYVCVPCGKRFLGGK